jgi:hypothetical protein
MLVIGAEKSAGRLYDERLLLPREYLHEILGLDSDNRSGRFDRLRDGGRRRCSTRCTAGTRAQPPLMTIEAIVATRLAADSTAAAMVLTVRI